MPRRGVRSFLSQAKVAVRASRNFRTPFASHTRKRPLSSPCANRRVFRTTSAVTKVHGTERRRERSLNVHQSEADADY